MSETCDECGAMNDTVEFVKSENEKLCDYCYGRREE
jgi:hypothetical protein